MTLSARFQVRGLEAIGSRLVRLAIAVLLPPLLPLLLASPVYPHTCRSGTINNFTGNCLN